MDAVTPWLDECLLYGKYQLLPTGGYVIEPIDELLLTPGGIVHGLHGYGPCRWQPYGTGFILTEERKPSLPICYFTSRGSDGMLLGLCNHDQEPQYVACLFPRRRAPQSSRLIYLVATCRAYLKQTMPPMLEQLAQQDIPASQIKVVVNGCEMDDNYTDGGIDYALSTHNGWEYSALYEAPLRWDFDHAMLIHDTSRLLTGFREKVERINHFVPFDYYPAGPQGRCMIGVYAKEFLLRLNIWLKGLDGIAKAEGITVECSGELVLRANRSCAMGGRHRDLGLETLHGTDQLRAIRLFPGANLEKLIGTGARRPGTPRAGGAGRRPEAVPSDLLKSF